MRAGSSWTTRLWSVKMPIRRRFTGRSLASETAPVAAKRGGYRKGTANHVRCGVCTREVVEEGLHLQRFELVVGSFCSPVCLAAFEALVALDRWAGDLDRHGRGDEAEAREALADQLLVLWRRGKGPDPTLVTEAVKLAQARAGTDGQGPSP
jgi:hypothetical protein